MVEVSYLTEYYSCTRFEPRSAQRAFRRHQPLRPSTARRRNLGWNLISIAIDQAYPKYFINGGSIAQWIAYLLLDPAATGLIPWIPVIFQRNTLSLLLRLINGTCWRNKDSGLKNVDRTHLVLGSGKPVLPKKIISSKETWQPSGF